MFFCAGSKKETEKGEAMYNNGFLAFIRHFKKDNTHHVKASCHAEMHKNVIYMTYVNISDDAIIESSHCECAAGNGAKAHCKHIILVLNALVHFTAQGCCITRSACTDVLQTFHQPNKSYYGTPLQASRLKTSSERACEIFDPRPQKFRNTGKVNARIHNGCAPSSIDIPMKQMLPPANRIFKSHEIIGC